MVVTLGTFSSKGIPFYFIVMHQVSLSEFQDAVERLDLLSLTSKEEVRKKYLKLSRLYHPDMPGGSTQKFQEIRDAYEVLTQYMESFRFVFDAEYDALWIKGKESD